VRALLAAAAQAAAAGEKSKVKHEVNSLSARLCEKSKQAQAAHERDLECENATSALRAAQGLGPVLGVVGFFNWGVFNLRAHTWGS